MCLVFKCPFFHLVSFSHSEMIFTQISRLVGLSTVHHCVLLTQRPRLPLGTSDTIFTGVSSQPPSHPPTTVDTERP